MSIRDYIDEVALSNHSHMVCDLVEEKRIFTNDPEPYRDDERYRVSTREEVFQLRAEIVAAIDDLKRIKSEIDGLTDEELNDIREP